MKEISLTGLKLKKVPELKESGCLKVTADGEMILYAVIRPEGVMRDRIEALCSQIDAGRGK